MGVRFIQGIKFFGGSGNAVKFNHPSVPSFTPVNFSYVFSALGSYTDITTNASNPNGVVFPDSLGSYPHLLGYTSPASSIDFTTYNSSVAQAQGNYTNASNLLSFRYFNGSIWQSLTSSLATIFNGAKTQTVSYTSPIDWAPTVINGVYAYWVELLYDGTYKDNTSTPVTQTYTAKASSISGTPVNIKTYTVTTFTTTGAGTWTKPAGVTEVVVECWGGGGAGGGVNNNNSGGSGGAGGQYAQKTIIYASAQQTISYTVGTGGTGGTGNGGNGGDTTWDTTVVVAKGGLGGVANVAGTSVPTDPYPAASGSGDVFNSGGQGGSGAYFSNPPQQASGGTGGGGAGSRNDGGLVGTYYTNFTGGSDFGGSGGAAGGPFTSGGGPGSPGNNYAAGGGGAAKISGANKSGGNGAQGIIRISYR